VEECHEKTSRRCDDSRRNACDFRNGVRSGAKRRAWAGGAPPAAAPRPGGGLTILDFKPAMDDLMTMLVQPRHIKLYFAGQAKNWTLAGFQLNELRASLARIGRTIPTYRNIGVDTAVASIFADKLKAVDAAIKASDLVQFNAAYGEMTAACNACHAGWNILSW
jgi:hypothetical protein